MDIELTERQKILKRSAREFLKREFPSPLAREFKVDLWTKMASLGWMGLILPPEYGGASGELMDLAILEEELGWALVPSPFGSTMACGLIILEAGNEVQKQRFLPKLASGKLIMAPALTEEGATYNPKYIEMRAMPSKDGYILEGKKCFVRDGWLADLLVTVARVTAELVTESGLTVFLVSAAKPGIKRDYLNTINKDYQATINFQGVQVKAEDILGTQGQARPVVERMFAYRTLLECAELCGVARKALEMTIEHARNRVQFGRPIGSFQVIQHRCADMLTDVDGCWLVTYYAIWRMQKGLPWKAHVSKAKAWVSDAVIRVTRAAQQIHAGVGYIVDHPLHLYYCRAKAGELYFGNSDFHFELIADELLH